MRLAALVLAVVCLAFSQGTDAAADDVSREWLDLWTRCRVSIETAQPLDAAGLEAVDTTPPVHDRVADADAWLTQGNRGGRFVVLNQQRKVDGGVVKKCVVDVAAKAAPLSDAEEASLVRSFLTERAKLIAAQSHVASDPSPIYPVVPPGLSPDKLNPNGCSVISTIMFDLGSDFFYSGTSEQVRGKCAGPTRLHQQ